ncbi:hypothetical protein A3F37_00550 [Candidatus Saccharibacteria bacterium RIFCSPHIGHO2_12_FULL_41_12]|nr:MAG: hypothetical protein A3F37_00550 [Candidatus Saccharibacteria bacterium RIFCSPHIGHO2_12_FULL_41_12]
MQLRFFSMLGMEKPKPIPPQLALIYGFPLAGIISQLLFWWGLEKRDDGFIFKTEKDFISELGITSAQQRLAIKKGKKHGFLTVKRMGVPAKRHYKIDFDLLVKTTIKEAAEKKVTLSISHYNNREKAMSPNGQNSRTTTESTPESTTRKGSTLSTADIIAKKMVE